MQLFNFLPHREQRQRSLRMRWWWTQGAAAALGLLVVLLWAGWVWSQYQTQLEDHATLNQQQQHYTPQLQQAHAWSRDIQQWQQRYATVQQAHATWQEGLQAMQVIAQLAAPDWGLQSVEYNAGQMVLAGQAQEAQWVTLLKTQLDQQTGRSWVQDEAQAVEGRVPFRLVLAAPPSAATTAASAASAGEPAW